MEYGQDPPTTHPQRVAIETADHRITGEVMLPSKGYRNRFSDLLNREDLLFVSVVNAEITELRGDGVNVQPFVAVARDDIRFAYELS